jgi:hypothetical protein
MALALRSCSPTARVFTALSLASLVTLLAGCPSSEASIDDAAVTRDGGAPRDSGPAADAAPADDAEPTRDADTTPDAEAADAAPAPDAEPAPDAAPVDAGIDRCGPVPRTAAGARLAAAIAAHTQRCNPELTAPEASWFGARGLELIGPALELPGLAYDAAEAGACGCAIEAAPCDLFDPLRELTSCRRTVTGTRAVDQPCRVTTECVEGTTCVPQFLEATGLGGLPLCSFEGACKPIVPDGMPCDFSTGACGPRSACVSFKGPGTCVPFAGLGRSCESVSCAGSEPASLGLPTTACASVNEASTCVALGRAGASCADAPCHPLYDCDEATLTCVLRPGDGDACSLSVDVATPTPDERGALIGEALYRCRVGDALGGRFSREFTRTLGGWSCVQTGTTTGRGTCRPMPTSGEACGFGPNLSASCEGASYCPGLDVSMPMSQAAICVASAGPGETCPLDGAYGAPCTPGAFCDFELRVCVDFSCGL